MVARFVFYYTEIRRKIPLRFFAKTLKDFAL